MVPRRLTVASVTASSNCVNVVSTAGNISKSGFSAPRSAVKVLWCNVKATPKSGLKYRSDIIIH